MLPLQRDRSQTRSQRFGVLVKRRYTENPPRVELEFTDQGLRLLELVRTVTRFVDNWHAGEDSPDFEHRSNEPETRNPEPELGTD